MNWKGITIHHSASHDVSSDEIDRWHKERGWKGIGYHFVVRENGNIELGRDINQQGAHNRGKNQSHIGVCVTGRFNTSSPSRRQIISLMYLVGGLCDNYDISIDNIDGHHDNCPGKLFPMQFLKNNIIRSGD